jgi:hypothetical protein
MAGVLVAHRKVRLAGENLGDERFLPAKCPPPKAFRSSRRDILETHGGGVAAGGRGDRLRSALSGEVATRQVKIMDRNVAAIRYHRGHASVIGAGDQDRDCVVAAAAE